MKLIVGLGNPGEKYERTRHNAGFWLLERYAAQTGIAMRKDAKFQALVGRHAGGVWLLMPQCFMNASGQPVQMLASFFKIKPAEIIVVHDELDFAPGVVKIKQGGGIAGHNGLRDISARLGTHDYWRLRLGIGHPGDRQGVTDYVLHRPGGEEREQIDAAITRALEIMPLILAGDMQDAMLKLHTQDKARQAPGTASAGDAASGAAPKKGSRAPAGEVKPRVEPPPGVPVAPTTGVAASSEEPAMARGLKSLLKRFTPGTDK